MSTKNYNNKKLLIDVSGGIAGDMFTAALISAGANFEFIREAMLQSASKLGSANISLHKTADDSHQLRIKLKSNRNHLRGSEAKSILAELFREFDITEEYRNLGMTATEILLKAEIRAHRDYNIVLKGDSEHFRHLHPNHHNHNHSHTHEEESFLHEAQDIVIDIMGAIVGMQDLQIEPGVQLLTPVSVGGGTVDCSHGILPVPAPATEVILDRYAIEWREGPLDVELSTPTGVAILAALGAKKHDSSALERKKIFSAGRARGTKLLDIPPLIVYLTQ